MDTIHTGIASAFALVLTACGPGAEPRVTNASAERDDANLYHLSWNAAANDTPVDVFVADQPNAPRTALRLVVDDDLDGRADVRLETANRPYFYVAADKGTGVWTAERVLPLAGGRNFRDLGGYRTDDGQHVAWGKIFRSGTMSGLTVADYDYLARLGIKVVCDFRTAEERKAEPNAWVSDRKIDYWARDYDSGFGELGKLLSSDDVTGEQVRAAMVEGYRRTPYEQAPAYREMFKRLAAGEIPLAFNCTAGKDRAGVAAALLLTALGVPRDRVVADYALSEKIVDFRKELTGGDDKAFSALAKLPPEVLAPLMRSDPAYIQAMFAEIERRHGTVANYLKDELGLTGGELQQIREKLLV